MRLAILLALLAAGCGSVYDASGVRALGPAPGTDPGSDPGNGLVCGAGQVVCGGICTTEDAQHCGAACEACPVPFAGATATCNAGACSHACEDGKLPCTGGCCAPSRIAAGAAHACAIAAGTGELFCWGANGSGQLGLADGADRAAPALVPGVDGATAVAAGGAHTCAIVGGGALRCFGAAGALPPAGVTASAVAAGDAHTCAIVGGPAATVQCWGLAAPAPSIASPTRVAAGSGFACAASASAVECRGALTTGFSSASTIVALAAGGGHVCAATASGGPTCWGDNASGQLGTGGTATPLPPTLADRLPNGANLVAAGAAFTCAGKSGDVSFKCAGANGAGQAGGAAGAPASPSPLDVTVAGALSALAAGERHACAAAGGALWCWGANDRGQAGAGAAGGPVLPAPVRAR